MALCGGLNRKQKQSEKRERKMAIEHTPPARRQEL
jgi:hypothetical protein